MGRDSVSREHGLKRKSKLVWGLEDFQSWLWKTVESWSFGSSVMAKCSILYVEMHWPQSYLLRDMGTVCLECVCKRAYVTWLMENHSFRGRQLLKPKMKAGVDVENRDVRRPRETEDAKHPVCHFGVMMTWS